MPARLRVTEHRAEVVRCTSCGRRTKAEFPSGVTAAVQYGPSVVARTLYLHGYQLLPYARAAEAMRELFGCAISAGALSTAVRRCATGLIETELKIKRGLRRSPVIHADEMGLRVKGKLVPAWLVEGLTARYDRRVAEGQEAQPPPAVPQSAWRQARNLLRRLERRKQEVLRFLSDPAVPFDNNQAERDLRMVKLQQKVSECFRTGEGARRFCRIRSYVSTARKQGRGVLRVLEGACRGVPLSVGKRCE